MEFSMAANSSINPWLDFGRVNLTLLPIQPCFMSGTITNCTDVCSNSTALFDPSYPSNLNTCGMWATLSQTPGLLNTSDVPEATAQFENLGLSIPSEESSYNLTFHIEVCFYTTCAYIKGGDALGCEECWHTMSDSVSLGNCIATICDPKGLLNPDLGGIGVYTAFIMQSVIAIVAFVGLLSLSIWHDRSKKRRRVSFNSHKRQHLSTRNTLAEGHNEILITAVIEFHKSQCYFAGAIQMAVIIFIHQQYELATYLQYSPAAALPFTLCTNGSIPVIFTLTSIRCYGRQSWYLTSLAMCSFVLSTITFIYSNYIYAMSYPVAAGSNYYDPTSTCGGWSPGERSSWCGSGFSMSTPIGIRTAMSGWNYMMWMITLLWALYCVIKQSLTAEKPQKNVSHSLSARFTSRSRSLIAFCDQWIKAGVGEKGKDSIFWTLFFISWSMAFGYQFYAYSLFFRHSEIDTTWSFGQIVAVTAWIPAIAEYIHLLRYGIQEGNEYRLKAPLIVTARQLTPASNGNHIQSHQQSGDAVLTSSGNGRSSSQENESTILPTTWTNSNTEIEMNSLRNDIQRIGRASEQLALQNYTPSLRTASVTQV